MLVRLAALEKRIGARRLFGPADLVVRAGDRIGIVGPNGAGKTTLLHTIHGSEPHDGGDVQKGRDVRIGLLRQEIDPRAEHGVRAEAQTAVAHLDALEVELRSLEHEMGRRGAAGEALPDSLTRRYDEASQRFERGGGFARHARVAEVLAGLGFAEAELDRPLSSWSGGWLMRVELAKLLLAQPDVLLLDEPTNHLDLPSIQFFESTLERFAGAVLVVSHDRTFLRRQANRIVELDGLGGLVTYETDYDRYRVERARRREELLARKANQDRSIAEQERFIERFRYKATKARQAQSRIKALERMERIEVEPEGRRSLRLVLPEPERSGERVLRLAGITKRYDETTVYEGVELEVHRGEKVALAGPNGAGKTTLLRIAAGLLAPDAGERELGHKVESSFFAQHQLEALDPGCTILEELERDARTEDVPRLRSLLGALLFTGDDVDKKISVLSGGEKARVALARLLLRPANLLILDEPTNHLDIEACEVLERAFADFPGTLLFVSHDRSFINAIATRVVEVDHGCLESHLGNYDDYLARKARGGGDGASEADATRKAPSARPRADAQSEAPTEAKAARLAEREQRKERDRLVRRIERLEEKITEEESARESVTAGLSDPEVFQNPERIQAIQAEEAEIGARIESLTEEWENLAERLAELEAELAP